MWTPPRSRRALALVTAGALLVALAACSDGSDPPSDPPPDAGGARSISASLRSHEWILDPSESTPDISGGQPPTIELGDDTVSGSGPCNTFRGQLELEGDEVDISRVTSTLMSCGADSDRAEQRFLRALEAVDRADVEDHGERMELTGRGDVRLVFDAFDVDAALLGEWHVIQLATGNAVEGLLPGSDPRLTFSDDGRLTLTRGGCNEYASTWEVDGDELDLEPLQPTTRRLCDMSVEGARQEQDLLRAIEQTAAADVNATMLTLVRKDGTITLVATRAP